MLAFMCTGQEFDAACDLWIPLALVAIPLLMAAVPITIAWWVLRRRRRRREAEATAPFPEAPSRDDDTRRR